MLLVTIDERRWMRGGYCDGKRRCAAGFLAESLGLLKRGAHYKPYYVGDSDVLEVLMHNDSGIRSDHLKSLIMANDDIRHGERRRKALRDAFSALGYRVRFIRRGSVAK